MFLIIKGYSFKLLNKSQTYISFSWFKPKKEAIESNYNSKNNISMANEVDKTKSNIMSVP